MTAGNGKTDGLFAASFVAVAAMVLVHHGIMFLGTRNWTWWMAGWYAFSFLMYFPVTTFLNDITHESGIYRGTFSEVMKSAPFWLSLVLTTSVILLLY